MRCGWLTDRFGLSWQIVPEALERLMADDDPAVVGRVTAAMLGMVKLDVAALEPRRGGVTGGQSRRRRRPEACVRSSCPSAAMSHAQSRSPSTRP